MPAQRSVILSKNQADLGFRVVGLGFGVQGLGCRVWGLGFKVQGLGLEGGQGESCTTHEPHEIVIPRVSSIGCGARFPPSTAPRSL